MPRMIPDWLIQTAWFVSSVFATGAVWYYLSQNDSLGIGIAIAGALLFAVIAIALHRSRDTLAHAATAASAPVFSLSSAPTRENIERVVLESDSRHDWSVHSDTTKTVSSYKHDVNLRLEMRNDDSGIQCTDFKEPWANKFPDRSATGYWCDLYYGSTHVARYVLVSVDGARALLPIPKRGPPGQRPNQVLPIEYKAAEIQDTLNTLEQYMRGAGLTVAQD